MTLKSTAKIQINSYTSEADSPRDSLKPKLIGAYSYRPEVPRLTTDMITQFLEQDKLVLWGRNSVDGRTYSVETVEGVIVILEMFITIRVARDLKNLIDQKCVEVVKFEDESEKFSWCNERKNVMTERIKDLAKRLNLGNASFEFFEKDEIGQAQELLSVYALHTTDLNDWVSHKEYISIEAWVPEGPIMEYRENMYPLLMPSLRSEIAWAFGFEE